MVNVWVEILYDKKDYCRYSAAGDLIMHTQLFCFVVVVVVVVF